MKICYVAVGTNMSMGKVHTHEYEVIKNLSKSGHKIYLLVKGFDKTTAINNVKMFSIKGLNSSMIGLSRAPHSFFTMLNINKEHDIDMIYTRLEYVGAFVSKVLKIPVIIEVNGISWEENLLRTDFISRMLNTLKNIFSFDILKIRDKMILNSATKVVVVTERMKELLLEENILKRARINDIIVINNGVNTEIFKPLDMDKNEFRKELNLSLSGYYINFTGNLFRYQGIEYLIKSAPLILEKCPNAKFLIVGDGQMKKELMELTEQTGASDKIIFTGAVPYEEVPKYINASDVCVVPKKPLKSGYSPLKLYEYMACGKPVVASNLPGFEILEQNEAGILVEPENSEELAEAIIKLLKDEKVREEMGRNGREYVVKNHSWENVARKVAEVCEEAIREHKNKRG
jgi:glycosyltransferase involved in cell wall biosynthesis